MRVSSTSNQTATQTAPKTANVLVIRSFSGTPTSSPRDSIRNKLERAGYVIELSAEGFSCLTGASKVRR